MVALVAVLFVFSTNSAAALLFPKVEESLAETFTVTPVPAESGSYTITPKLPADGKVSAGTVLTVKAKPASGFSLDAVYYTVKGGIWGTTSHESFSHEMKITVTKDMVVGATFVPRSLVKDIKVTQDVVCAKPGVKPLKYDVYSPKGAKKLPIIVIIHGGGWSSNNEDIMRGLARELVKGGKYVVISIDYRWINKLDGEPRPTYMHSLIEDVFGAIAHIQEHAAWYGGDPNRIGVTGDSAGGHLAEAAATLSPLIGAGGFGASNGVYQYMPTYLPKGKSVDEVKIEITSAIRAVAPSYGASDASDFKELLEQTDQAYWDAISPLKHVPNVSERALPHFMVRGTEDQIVPHAMVQRYVDALKAAGQPVQYIQVEGAGHAFFDWKPDAATRATFARYGVKYAAEMQSFFNHVFFKG
ncbi:alpha/beta hydrolase [Rufibacter sp. H-1]|uniref:Alpha/beta hydrolase n=1 Tax=Rufibacter sediminis TaxID=2762756 RepID=A0ABR6VPG6_9BACT|nr:alpha/beta hydrolase [Rufibacter sediminis]